MSGCGTPTGKSSILRAGSGNIQSAPCMQLEMSRSAINSASVWRRRPEIAHHGFVLSQGRVVASGTARELAEDAEVCSASVAKRGRKA